MENLTTKINAFLPFGESLREVLQHASIKKTDINKVLKAKGIFVSNIEDEVTFPLLLTNYISPYEFDILKNKLRARDDREKIITRTFEWSSPTNLINAIPQNLNLQEIIQVAYPKYKIIGVPSFSMIDKDPNNIRLEFVCESYNYSKAWYRTDNQFKGSVAIKKIKDDNIAQLQIVHTSPETTEVGNKVAAQLEKHFRSSKYINENSNINRIVFGDFTNEERIAFFMRFTRGNRNLIFSKVSYVDIAPSPEEALPNHINWLELAKVKELHINGENLQNVPFISDRSLNQYIELSEMSILYAFQLNCAEGTCKITFGFPKFFKRRISSIEFVVDVENIKLKENYRHISEISVRRLILNEFESLKSDIYNEIKTNHEH